jgi:hypothetical protein
VYRGDPSFCFTKSVRGQLDLILDGADIQVLDWPIDDAEDAARYYRDHERKQSRDRGNARGPNRQARDQLAGKLAWTFDVAYCGEERDRRGRKAEFVHLVLREVGARVPKLELGDMPTQAENWAVRTTPGASPTAIDLGRALRSGVPLLKDRIWERLVGRAAAAGVSVNRFVEEDPEGRELAKLRSGELRGGKWVSLYFTPIDTALEDAALSERCRRLGVRLDSRFD